MSQETLNTYADAAVRLVHQGQMTEVQAVELLSLWCRDEHDYSEAAKAYVDAEARSIEGDES